MLYPRELGEFDLKIQRGIKFRLYPTPEQAEALEVQAHAARAMWNLLHDWWTWGGRHRRPTLTQADRAIRQARKDIPWLSELPAQAAQQVLKQYHRAWIECWEGRANPPKFKSRVRSRMAVDAPQASKLKVTQLSSRWSTVNIPKIGTVRFRSHRKITGTITGSRLVWDANGWHVVFRSNWEVSTPDHPGKTVGVDRGVKVPLALSTGENITHPSWVSPKQAERHLRLERKAARRLRSRTQGQPTSNRLKATYDKIHGSHSRAARRRADWQHKATHALAEAYSLIGLENLNLTGMTRSAKGTVDNPGRNVSQKAGLNRSIAGESWGQLHEQLAYKTTERGGQVVVVPAHYTSQRCHRCGFTDPKNRKNQAAFACQNPTCGWAGNADTNAAKNIHLAALRAVREPAPGSGVAGRGALQPAGGATKRQPKRKRGAPSGETSPCG